MTGYSLKFAKLVNKTSENISIGVTLGKACIEKDVPVMQIAKHFNVSRTAVYAWFTGKSIPNLAHQMKIHKLLKRMA
jgi:transcriptional regulator with XRE-family HTH domain